MIQDKSCHLCRLHNYAQNVCIPGRGSDKPRYLFVGQNPGKEEDIHNLPFVGPSGRVLTSMIEKYDLKPARLTNVVRCLSPGDRTPKKDEILACKNYILKEIESTKPEFIITLGGVALRALTGKSGVLNYSGEIVGNINGAKIFSMLHPSFALHSPKSIYKIENQFKELKRISINQASTNISFEVVTEGKALDQIIEGDTNDELDERKFVSFDIETDGKYENQGGKIRCISFCTGDKTFVVPGNPSNLFKSLSAQGVRLCAHNSVFERRWLYDLFGEEEEFNIKFDTMLFDYLWHEEYPHDLESVATYWLKKDFVPWKINLLMLENNWTWKTVPDEVLFPYNAKDSFYTYKICQAQLDCFKKLDDKSILKYYQKVLHPTSTMCARYEHRGFKVDTDWISKISKEFQDEKNSLLNKMIDLSPEHLKEFNPRSPKQISNLLEHLHIETEKTKTGLWTTSKDALEKVVGKSPFVGLYLRWKNRDDLQNDFLLDFMERASSTYNSMVYSTYKPAFQVTGRVSAVEPPATNIPRDKYVRGMIVSRWMREGGKIIALDYSQQEYKILASESDDKNLLTLFSEGRDLHDETASLIFGKKFTQKERSIAKNINFGTIYGITPWSLSKKFGVTENKAEDFLSAHRRMFPGVYKWIASVHDFVRQNGFVKNKFGHIRHFPNYKNVTGGQYFEMLRQAANFLIQSLGASITNIAASETDKFLRKNFNSLVFHQVHDSILIDAHPKDDFLEIEKYCKRIMSEIVPNKFAPFLKVKLNVDAKTSIRWGAIDLEEEEHE